MNLNFKQIFKIIRDGDVASRPNLGQIRRPKSQSGTWINLPKLFFWKKVSGHPVSDICSLQSAVCKCQTPTTGSLEQAKLPFETKDRDISWEQIVTIRLL